MIKFAVFIFCLLCSFSYAQEEKKPYNYYLSICCIFNNDGPWLKEWIEYHKLVGVEHFILYNNESNDNYREVLEPYIAAGEVTLVDWPDRPQKKEIYGWVFATQLSAYRDAIKRMQGETCWLAIIDTDEFLLPLKTLRLTEFLHEYEPYGALGINWVCYGTSLYEDIPKDKLMIETLTYRFSDSNTYCTKGKTIVRPEYVADCLCPHTFSLINGMKPVDSNGQPFIHEKTKNLDKIVINHYFTRTLNFFYLNKLPRKLKMDSHPLPEDHLKIMLEEANAQEDLSIGKFVPALRKKMGLDIL